MDAPGAELPEGLAADLAMATGAQQRMSDWLAALEALDPSRPSRLPGWSVGHVLTHIARNADSFTGLLEAAAAGEVGTQYPGGKPRRDGDIAAGATRSWPELTADVVAASGRLQDAFATTTPDAWATATGDTMRGVVPISRLPFLRTREVEVHRVDTGLGATPTAWDDRWVRREWSIALRGLPARIPEGTALDIRPSDGEPVVVGDGEADLVTGPTSELLAWTLGRHEIEGAPTLTPWS